MFIRRWFGHLLRQFLLIIIILILWAVLTLSKSVKAEAPTWSAQEDQRVISFAKCESGLRNDIKILDTNNRYSYGWLQFQMQTFLYFGKLYGILPKDTTPISGEKLIYDKEITSRIFLAMYADNIVKDHWVICSQKIAKSVGK